MRAQEMFEELGIEKISDHTAYILYGGSDNIGIYFSKVRKGYALSFPDEYIDDFKDAQLLINIDMHKAIHQQMKELGWLDE